MNIAFTGIEDESLKMLQEGLEVPVANFTEVPEKKIHETLQCEKVHFDVFIVGEHVGSPIKVAQDIYGLDSYLSIVIVNDEKSYQKIKQALMFAPFLGNTVKCISNNIGKGMISVITDSYNRTNQRRNYAKLKSTTPTVSLSNSNLYESIKTEYLDKFLEEAPIGAILMNEDGLILALNRNAGKILFKSERELLGVPLQSIFPDNIQESLQAFISTGFHQNSSKTFERFNNNKKQYIELRIAEISSKRIPYKLGILTDITNTTLAQQKIEYQLDELEVINKNLKRANADLDAFVYTASHDLKAPISNIEGLVDLLEKRVDASESDAEQLFKMIKHSIHRFKDTIKDLTEVAMLQKNQAEDEDSINICEMIEEVQVLIKEMIISSNALIEVNCNINEIKFSRSNLRSIIYNLLSNAIKYHSPERDPIIKITTEPVDNYLLLAVEDNGLGFALEKKEKIFTMFQRLHNHTEGTGIGLYIVKRIIDNTGGKIEVESEPGKGSKFSIYLKLR